MAQAESLKFTVLAVMPQNRHTKPRGVLHLGDDDAIDAYCNAMARYPETEFDAWREEFTHEWIAQPVPTGVPRFCARCTKVALARFNLPDGRVGSPEAS